MNDARSPYADLDSISPDFPLAYHAASLLKPFRALAGNEFAHGKHAQAAAAASNMIPKPVLDTVNEAVKQLSEHVLALRREVLIHPEQKPLIDVEIEAARNASSTLTHGVSDTLVLMGINQTKTQSAASVT